MFQPIVTDVVIIGAGPVGLFGVFECGMLKMRCHDVDTLDAIGGQCTGLYPEKPSYDIPGFPRIAAGGLVDSLTRQAAPFRPVYHLGQTVTRLYDRNDGSIEVVLSGGDTLVARAVIIAAGGGTLGPNRPPLKGIEGYEGRHVIYRITRVEALRGRRIVVAGGGDSAVDWTLALLDVAERVMLVHRRHKFRAAPASVDTLLSAARQGRVDLVTPYQLHGLEGDGRVLTGITTPTKRATCEGEADAALFGISTGRPDRGMGSARHQQIVVTPSTETATRRVRGGRRRGGLQARSFSPACRGRRGRACDPRACTRARCSIRTLHHGRRAGLGPPRRVRRPSRSAEAASILTNAP